MGRQASELSRASETSSGTWIHRPTPRLFVNVNEDVRLVPDGWLLGGCGMLHESAALAGM